MVEAGGVSEEQRAGPKTPSMLFGSVVLMLGLLGDKRLLERN